MARYYIKTEYRDCIALDGFMTQLEMWAFGWKSSGMEREFEGYDIEIVAESETRATGKATARFKTWYVFKRISPYSSNPFFILLEVIMRIVSWIRRKLFFLFGGLIIMGTIVSLIARETEIVGAIVGLLSLVYGPSLVVMILGFLFRKISGIDKKLRKELEENGYSLNQHNDY